MNKAKKTLQICRLKNIFSDLGLAESKIRDKQDPTLLWVLNGIRLDAFENVKDAIGDKARHLEQFIYDNDWGENGFDGVNNIADLLEMIEGAK